MNNTTNQLQKKTREYLDTEWDNEKLKHSLGLTLTMKQINESEPLDPIKSERNFRHFINRLERKVYSHSKNRYGKNIKRFPVLERTNKRFHYHVLIEKPKFSDGTRMDKGVFVKLIKESWLKTSFGYRMIDIQELDSKNPSGWGYYITKFQDSEDNRTDWGNVR